MPARASAPPRPLPADIPQSRFWSVIIYDRQTRSMLQTDQHLPRLGSQSGTVEANPDGTTDLYFGPTAPDGKESNWLHTVPGKGWWPILRLYNPRAGVLRQDLTIRRSWVRAPPALPPAHSEVRVSASSASSSLSAAFLRW